MVQCTSHGLEVWGSFRQSPFVLFCLVEKKIGRSLVLTSILVLVPIDKYLMFVLLCAFLLSACEMLVSFSISQCLRTRSFRGDCVVSGGLWAVYVWLSI